MRDVFNREEAAEYLGLHPSTITELCHDGALRHAKIGRALRIRREWCNEYLEAIAAGGEATPVADRLIAQAAG